MGKYRPHFPRVKFGIPNGSVAVLGFYGGNQFGGPDVERTRELKQGTERRLAQPPFQQADIGTVQATVQG